MKTFRQRTLGRGAAALATITVATTLAVPLYSAAPAAASARDGFGPIELVIWGRDGWGLGCKTTVGDQTVTVPSGTVVSVDVIAPDGHKIRTDYFKCVNGEWKQL
jgi:hypothetical protein